MPHKGKSAKTVPAKRKGGAKKAKAKKRSSGRHY